MISSPSNKSIFFIKLIINLHIIQIHNFLFFIFSATNKEDTFLLLIATCSALLVVEEKVVQCHKSLKKSKLTVHICTLFKY